MQASNCCDAIDLTSNHFVPLRRVASLSNKRQNAIAEDAIALRPPDARDGAKMFEFVRAHGGLEQNSAYAYMLICERFSQCCVIAEAGEAFAGFVLGVTSPTRPDALFVWQIGVNPQFRSHGLGVHMLETLLLRTRPRFLEAHVATGNAASDALFRSVGRKHAAPIAVSAGYLPDWFPEPHVQEHLYCIGPFAW